MVQQIKSEVLDNRRVGNYHVLSLTAPGIADSAQPGQCVTIAMGGEGAAHGRDCRCARAHIVLLTAYTRTRVNEN